MAGAAAQLGLGVAFVAGPSTAQGQGFASAEGPSACTGRVRAGDDSSGTVGAYTVYGKIHTPSNGEISGWGSGNPSAADVFLSDGTEQNFVQAGWYVGSAENLPYASSPRMFVGESDASSTYGEDLRAGPVLGWSASHIVRISYAVNGYYDIYLSGTYEFSTLLSHAFMGHAGFVGEVDATCTGMGAYAYIGSYDSTLTWNDTNGTHHLFVDAYHSDNSQYTSVEYVTRATNAAYGP